MRTLRGSSVTVVLERLIFAGEQKDESAKARVREREAKLGRKVDGRERAELCRSAPIAVTREVGELLYVLALASGARTIVEFGASLGFSTIYLAAAIRDATAGGTLVSTELDQQKARTAAANLTQASLADLVDLRVGDARSTLADTPEGPIDLLFLDGWNELYLEILALIEPRLPAGALVIADLSASDPDCDRYLAHVSEPASGYATLTVPLDAGVAVSVRETA